ncbi:MAG TPA: class I SAM-dependent methyltransferase [Kiloniellaceae bacterium]|nr:class I SAM-dependent methyltransferase [Kiloniellaceae bacterium]
MPSTLPSDDSATAHHAWDHRWQSESGRADWLDPDPDVAALIPTLKARGLLRALDLGCGVGRHACYLASEGLTVHAMDASPAGLEFAAQQAREHGLAIDFREGLMTDLPYDDGSFDYVLSFNVIYHGDGGVVSRAIAEIQRVLKPGGIFQGTMLSKRNANFGIGTEVAPNTFIVSDAGDGDKNHPHFYCDAAELLRLFEDFELLSLADREHSRPGSYHWHLVAERP